jgi:hypothetical protein
MSPPILRLKGGGPIRAGTAALVLQLLRYGSVDEERHFWCGDPEQDLINLSGPIKSESAKSLIYCSAPKIRESKKPNLASRLV